MSEVQCDTLAELRLIYKESLQEVFSVCSRVFIHTKENRIISNLEQQDGSVSEDDLEKSTTENVPHTNIFENVDSKHEADTVSCYCSASHTDNISTDEHDSLRDSHVGQAPFKGLHSSDSGTDLTETKHDYENAWQKYWSLHGETIIWKSWIAKYSAYINPDYLDYSGNLCSECNEGGQCCSNECKELSKLNKEDIKSTRFSFEEKDIQEVVTDSSLEIIDQHIAASNEHYDLNDKHELAFKNRMLIRNLSGSDSYDKLQTEISEGWNPLSPASVEGETEAERLLSSRCGSHASSSHRTFDSMTNVTRMTVSSIDLSQSSKDSNSFSSVSSVRTSSSSSSSDDLDDNNDYEQQWNVLWKKHYEEEYLENYSKFMCSRTQDFDSSEKKTCAEGQLEKTFETLTMAESTGDDSRQEVELDKSILKEEMLAMGLPTSFSSHKQSIEMETKTVDLASPPQKRRLADDAKSDEASVSKMKASFTLMGMEYHDDHRQKFVGTVEYKKKNIRFQNRQLKILKDKRPKHIHFDDDGNAIPSSDGSNLLQQHSGSSDLKDSCSSSEDTEDTDINKPSLVPVGDSTDKNETLTTKRRKRKKKNMIPPEIKDKPYLKKYWQKRFSLFSKFEQGVQLDEESWFSVTPEAVAKHHAKKFRNFDVIVDGFCGVGGNSIQFAVAGLKVIAIDIDPEKIRRAKHNARIYGVEDKIKFVVGDFLEMAQTFKADAVFLSPPWGGPSYLKQKVYELDQHLQPVPFTEIMECAKKISTNIGVYLPRNSNTHTLLLAALGRSVEIEQNFVSGRLVAITAYYNDLISSQ